MHGSVRHASLAAALIVCTISLIPREIGEAQRIGIRVEGERIAVDNYDPAKHSYVLRCFGEDVVVFCPTPEIQKFLASLDVREVLGRYRVALRSGAAETASLWREEGYSDLTRRMLELEVGGKRGVPKFTGCMDSHVLGGGIAGILPDRPESPVAKAILPQNPFPKDTFSTYEGAVVSDKGFFREPGLSVGDVRENNRESGDDYRREGLNVRTIAIKKNPCATDNESDALRHRGQGETFCLLSGAIVAALIGYALLKNR